MLGVWGMHPLSLSVRGGLGVGDARVIIVVTGRGVVGWVVVIASLT